MLLDSVLNEFLINLNSFKDITKVPEEFSCQLIWKFVDGNGLQDDLLFFVSTEEKIQVCRHVPNQRPSLDIKVNWTASLVLNLICQMNFRLRITSCSYEEGEIPGISHLVINESTNKKVYASPLEAHLNNLYESSDSLTSQTNSTYAFPDIYFIVQDYETCFENMQLGPDGILIVELFCGDGTNNSKSDLIGTHYEKIDTSISLFQGAISNKSLSEAYQRNTAELGAIRGSFIMMTGPSGLGEAQLHAIDPAETGDLDEIILSKIVKTAKDLKRFVFGSKIHKNSEAIESPTVFNCRLTFIRLHWQKLLDLLKTKQKMNNK